ncbi:uncharacterized protein [Venturia canescens]|uniref:uncharacterized protein n=1 Tax=Venturia canescens TaxID=32260 RepID=UPI001C9D56EB|nr:uncharacterized protein LOC122406254 [Venturia canescens]
MYSPVWIYGLSFVAIAAAIDDQEYEREQKVMKYEAKVCEPLKKFIHPHRCADCICRLHGYGNVCEKRRNCYKFEARPQEDRECTPALRFTTKCHLCKCSSTGLIDSCVAKNSHCMDDILDGLVREKEDAVPQYIENLDKYPFDLAIGDLNNFIFAQ